MTTKLPMRWMLPLLAAVFTASALATEFRTVEAATILYDAPSLRGSKLFVIKRGTPVELVVNLEGWAKVRDADGSLAWIEAKHLGTRRMVIVVAARGQVRQAAQDSSPVVFEAEKSVSLDFLETVPGAWVKVRHRDGPVGFIKISQIWGI